MPSNSSGADIKAKFENIKETLICLGRSSQTRLEEQVTPPPLQPQDLQNVLIYQRFFIDEAILVEIKAKSKHFCTTT